MCDRCHPRFCPLPNPPPHCMGGNRRKESALCGLRPTGCGEHPVVWGTRLVRSAARVAREPGRIKNIVAAARRSTSFDYEGKVTLAGAKRAQAIEDQKVRTEASSLFAFPPLRGGGGLGRGQLLWSWKNPGPRATEQRGNTNRIENTIGAKCEESERFDRLNANG